MLYQHRGAFFWKSDDWWSIIVDWNMLQRVQPLGSSLLLNLPDTVATVRVSLFHPTETANLVSSIRFGHGQIWWSPQPCELYIKVMWAVGRGSMCFSSVQIWRDSIGWFVCVFLGVLAQTNIWLWFTLFNEENWVRRDEMIWATDLGELEKDVFSAVVADWRAAIITLTSTCTFQQTDIYKYRYEYLVHLCSPLLHAVHPRSYIVDAWNRQRVIPW